MTPPILIVLSLAIFCKSGQDDGENAEFIDAACVIDGTRCR